MLYNKGSLLLFYCFLQLLAVPLFGQQKPANKIPQNNKIVLVANIGKQSIKFRWAVTNSQLWSLGNKYGYILERYTVSRDGKLLLKAEKKILGKGMLKPKPAIEWEQLAQKDDYAAVLAQALYGEKFEISGGGDTSTAISRMVTKSSQNHQRYSGAMMGADLSFDAACFAALGYEDNDVNANEKYLYRLYSQIPKKIIVTDTLALVIALSDYKPLPKPDSIFTTFGNRTVLLSWDYENLQRTYSSCFIEKSVDGGKIFARVLEKPLNYIENTQIKKEDNQPRRFYWTDTLIDNKTIYQYRVVGLSSFAELGPPSPVAIGHGRNLLAYTPNISYIKFDENGIADINWDIEKDADSLLKDYSIAFSPKMDGEYKNVINSLPPGKRQTFYKSNAVSGYLKITANPKEGEGRTSFPYLMQSEDSVAPAMPTAFMGSVDTLGNVTLTWHNNSENDLDGYKLFRANLKGEEYATIGDTLYMDTVFHEKLSLNSLNKKVYYTVKAVDKHYNQSAFAPVIEIKRPDIIPPSQPVFTNYEIKEIGVYLKWANSPDEDVAKHTLYRKLLSATVNKWDTLKVFYGKIVDEYIDKECKEAQSYSYTIIATDSANLQSDPAPPITLSIPRAFVKIAIKKLAALIDRDKRQITLNWEPIVKDISQYEIFRGEDKEKLSLYKVMDATEQTISFTDTDLRVNTKYQYGIRAIYSDGRASAIIIKDVTY
jgi:uncharacterized protein